MARGAIVTNHHVIDGCSSLRVNGTAAKLRGSICQGQAAARNPYLVTRSVSSRASRISAFTMRDNSRSICRCLPLQAFLDAVALPSGERGPVERSHGFHTWISNACCARCSGVLK